jgi:hypothetical protein
MGELTLEGAMALNKRLNAEIEVLEMTVEGCVLAVDAAEGLHELKLAEAALHSARKELTDALDFQAKYDDALRAFSRRP